MDVPAPSDMTADSYSRACVSWTTNDRKEHSVFWEELKDGKVNVGELCGVENLSFTIAMMNFDRKLSAVLELEFMS